MTDLNAIRARLGSLSPTTMKRLPKAVQKLLTEDLPELIEIAKQSGPSDEQKIDQAVADIPW